MAEKPKKIPVRYIGQGISLQQHPDGYKDADGKPLKALWLNTGDTIMMDEAEATGQTYLFDPRGEKDPLYLGAGHKILPEHAGISKEKLIQIGYEFHLGRQDVEVIPIFPAQEQSSENSASLQPEEG